MAIEDPQFFASYHAMFRARSEEEAVFIADQIKVNGEKDLDPEDGDTFDVIQVTDNPLDLSPEQAVTLLRRTRNMLIRSKSREFYDLAQLLDKAAYSFERHLETQEGYETSGYDYASWMRAADEVLAGRNPLTY